MTTEFTDAGLTVDTYDTAKAKIEENLRAEFGENVDLSSDGPIGHLVELLSIAIAELCEAIEDVSNAFNPQTSTGTALSSLVLLNGIQRQVAARSTVTLECTANAAGSTIPAGSQARDPATGITWATDAELVLAASTSDTVSATCTENGAYDAAADTITEIVTPVYGWASVTNPAAASPGRTQETDAALRLRRQEVAERASTVSASALYAAVSDVDGVDAVRVIVNDSGATDDYGVPAHSVWTIVNGGSDADIAEAIFNHVAAGVGTHGDTTVSYADPVSGQSFDVNFGRFYDVDIYFDIEVATDADFPVDGVAQLKAAAIAYIDACRPGEDVSLSRVYSYLNEIPGHEIEHVWMAITTPDSGDVNPITMAPDERPAADESTVTVNGE